MYTLDVKGVVDFSGVPDDTTTLLIKANHQKLFFNTPLPDKIDKLHIYHCHDIDFSSERIFHNNLKELCLNIREPLNEKFLNEIAQSKVVTFGYACRFPFDVKYLPKNIDSIKTFTDTFYSGEFPFEKIKTIEFGTCNISSLKQFINLQNIVGKVNIDTTDFSFPELKKVKLVCYPDTSFPKLIMSIKKCINLVELTINMDDNGSKYLESESEFNLTDTNIKKMYFIHDGITTTFDDVPLRKRIVFISRPKFSENLKKLELKQWWNRCTRKHEDIPLDDLPSSLVELSLVSSQTNLDFSKFVNVKNLKITFKIEKQIPSRKHIEKKHKLDTDIDDMFDDFEEYIPNEDCLIKVYPPNLEKLSISVDGFKLGKFPDTVKELCIVGPNCKIQELPSQLTSLKLDVYPEFGNDSNYKIVFPATLTHLSTNEFFYNIRTLPVGLLSLEIVRLYRNEDLLFLKHLENLHTLKIESYNVFYCTLNKKIEFPDSLRVLHIDSGYDSIIPPFIEELCYV